MISWGCDFVTMPATKVRTGAAVNRQLRLLFIAGEWALWAMASAMWSTFLSPGEFRYAWTPSALRRRGICRGGRWLHCRGHLSKTDKDQLPLLRSLMRDADLPTRLDCTPVVFAIANAFGAHAQRRRCGPTWSAMAPMACLSLGCRHRTIRRRRRIALARPGAVLAIAGVSSMTI